MIVDRLEHIGYYRNLSSNFDAAIAFLEKADLGSLTTGQFEIKGQQVYGIVSDRMLEEEPTKWEIHKKYADVQLVLDGSERIGWCTLEKDFPSYDEEKDVAFAENMEGMEFTLNKGDFMILFPQDVHCPNGPAPENAHSRKLVLKVRLE